MRRILCIYLMFIPFPGISQTKIALTAGINLASINFKDFNVEKRSLTRLNAGIMMNIPFEDDWSVLTGIYYSGKGVIHSRRFATSKIDSVTIRLNYIELPVNIAYKLPSGNNKNIVFATGPYVGYGFNGEIFTINSSRPPQKHLHKKETDKYKRLDFGFNVTTLYEINNTWGLRFDYSNSITNLYRGDKQRNSVFGFSFFHYLKNKKDIPK